MGAWSIRELFWHKESKDAEKSETGTIKRKRKEKVESKKEAKGVKERGGNWTEDERVRFIAAIKAYGRNWVKVSEHVGTKDVNSVKG